VGERSYIMNEQQEFSVTFKVSIGPDVMVSPAYLENVDLLTDEIRVRVVHMVGDSVEVQYMGIGFDPTTVEVTPTNTIAPISTSVRESAAPVFVEPAAPTTSPRKSWLRRAVRQG
jgi:hypothetical protein